jgi:1,4-dihydroxy-2-naphthoyl-CoA hydrolase
MMGDQKNSETVMRIWKKEISVEALETAHLNSATTNLGIEFLEVGDDFIRARAPVDSRTAWGEGLHSGVNVVLAETLGSCGAHYATPPNLRSVGLSIVANYLKTPTSGWITGITRPVKNDASGQVWEIQITDDEGHMVCVSQITMALLNNRQT